jgi:hypothetical protein
MRRNHYRSLSVAVLLTALLTPGLVIARSDRGTPAPAEGIMRVNVTYTEEGNITDKTKYESGAAEEDIATFNFRATAAFEQRVMIQPVAGAGVNFYAPENAKQQFSGGVSYNGEIKRTGTDEKQRASLDEKSVISFAGVISEDSATGPPDDNAAGIQFGIQANMTGGCQGKRTNISYPGGNEKKVETFEINSCGVSDETHIPALITRAPLNVDMRQASDGKEFGHYADQFHVTTCNLNPQYCTELKATGAGANVVENSDAMSQNWIGGTTTGNVAQGFIINVTMFKELKVPGVWKRYLQMNATVTPVTKSRSALDEAPLHSLETADRCRVLKA